MRNLKIAVIAWTAVCTLGISIVSAAGANGSGELATQAYQILKARCYQCHGGQSEYADLRILDHDLLVADRGKGLKPLMVAGDPAESKIWKVIDDDTMPDDPNEKLSAAEKNVIKQWIEQGGQFPNAGVARPFVSNLEVLKSIGRHLYGTENSQREFLRYFVLTHLHNNPTVSDIELRLHRAAFSKAVNSLSREANIVLPEAVDEQQTVFAIDRRDFGWTSLEDWEAVIKAYPYGLKPTDSLELEEYSNIERQYGKINFDGIPYLRADWFTVTATRPPIYHQLAGIPETRQELEDSLGVKKFEENFARDRLKRAGMVQSGVSRQNRLVERHDSNQGAYWISYDFQTNGGKGNLMRFPLGPVFDKNPFNAFAFEHAGGEIVFSRPNKLHGYMLIDAQGQRIDVGPIEIVYDLKQITGTPQIVTGLSCMSCHKNGIIDFQDVIRDGVELYNNEATRKVKTLFVDRAEMDKLLLRDRTDYLRALEEAIGSFLLVGDDADKQIGDFPEPISEVARMYEKDLDLNRAAAELFQSEPESLGANVKLNKQLIILGLKPLQNGQTVKRSMWDAREGSITTYQRAARELSIGTPVP